MCTEDHKVVLYSLLLYMLDATHCITNPNPNPNDRRDGPTGPTLRDDTKKLPALDPLF